MAVALALPGWGTSTQRMVPLCGRLRARGLDARPFGYDATGSITSIGRTLAGAVDRAEGAVHLIGHSLGGLAAASAVLDHGADVATVTTVNSPWRGTWVAWTAHPGDPLGHELRWRSEALARLRGALGEHLAGPTGPRWSIVGTAGDLATTPLSAVRVPSGDRLTTLVVPTTGHSVSLGKAAMLDAITDLVAPVAT